MLHGEVLVNEIPVVGYQITNEGQSMIDTDCYIYHVVVWGTDRGGYKYSYNYEMHARSSAPGLVGMVLTEIDGRLNENTSWTAAINDTPVRGCNDYKVSSEFWDTF